MAGRTLWKGYIHFRGIHVPVKLHNAVKEERIQFHLLHRHDHVKLEQRMVCAYEKVTVPREEQTRGFELEEGRYILVDPMELEQTEPENSRMIEVHEFVRAIEIDPLFLDRVHYLEPDTPLQEYDGLVRVLEDLDMQGICTWTMRKRSYLGALQAKGKTLRLNTLRYADEIVSAKSLNLESIPVSEKELEIGSDLINKLTGPFQPQKFENEHQKKLQDFIDRKARGEKIAVLRPRRLRPTRSDKLLEALEASLKKAV
jgi:DNA end-binding protein Ku